MKDNMLCCRCKTKIYPDKGLSNDKNNQNQSICGHFGVKVKHRVCVEMWCFALQAVHSPPTTQKQYKYPLLQISTIV